MVAKGAGSRNRQQTYYVYNPCNKAYRKYHKIVVFKGVCSPYVTQPLKKSTYIRAMVKDRNVYFSAVFRTIYLHNNSFNSEKSQIKVYVTLPIKNSKFTISIACAQPQLLLTGKVESAQQRNNARNADAAKVAASV